MSLIILALAGLRQLQFLWPTPVHPTHIRNTGSCLSGQQGWTLLAEAPACRACLSKARSPTEQSSCGRACHSPRHWQSQCASVCWAASACRRGVLGHPPNIVPHSEQLGYPSIQGRHQGRWNLGGGVCQGVHAQGSTKFPLNLAAAALRRVTQEDVLHHGVQPLPSW